ncbi:MAG: efflux RND transporter periplasmic adaptor subunit [Gracilibacteraceae bacterium]|jgi:multidrug efflux pump subunit AcrA (membrane-fusion protein)|nr:efflux RND transporter periplasmic adaptor subunit [Gracilibacteraceae bacterium]
MKKRNIIIGVAAVAVLVIIIAVFRGLIAGSEPAVDHGEIIVETTAPTRGDISVIGEYIGSLAYAESVYVYPKTGGMVTATYFQPGDTVRRGDVLLSIEAEELAMQAAQAQAAYLAAVNGAEQAIVQLETALAAAEMVKNDTQTNLARMQQLYEAGAVAAGELEQMQTGYDNALLQYEAARASYELTVGQGAGTNGAAANAQVAMAREALNAAETQLAYAQVTAPMDGIVDRKLVGVYDMASPQSCAYVITNHESMRVSFQVPARSVEALHEGDAVTVLWSGNAGVGRIVEIAAAIDPAGGLFDVKAVIAGADGLYAGSSVKVRATSRQAKNALLIPLDCLYYEDGVPCVYLLKEGKALKTGVEVGVFNEKTAEIISGLSLSDQIIATWHPSLADGTNVKTTAEAEN